MGLPRAITLTDRDRVLLAAMAPGPVALSSLFWRFFASDEDRRPGKRPDYAKIHRRMAELEEYGFVAVVGEPNRPKTGHLTELGRQQLEVLRAHASTSDDLRPPEEWQGVTGVTIYDADGWHQDGKPWSEPITRAEFLERAGSSTVLADVPGDEGGGSPTV